VKIVHVCLLSSFTDGWNYQDNLLTKYHRRLGHEVSVIASTQAWDDSGKKTNLPAGITVNPEGIRIIRLETRKSRINSRLNRYEGLYSAIESEKPDVLFIHNCQYPDADVLARYLKKHKTRAYVDNHADFANSAQGWLSRNILHKLLWRHCAQLLKPHVRKFYGVLPSRVDFLRDVYRTPTDKTELLVMGTDDELADAAEKNGTGEAIREKYGIADDDFLIMTGGKIDMNKLGMLHLMEAVQKLDMDKLRLIVFGSVAPELKEKLEALCDGKKVQYIGWVNAKDTYGYFAAADLVCFPCLHSVFWEQAAGQGKPLLVRSMDGFRHVDLGGNTAFIDEISVEGISRCIREIAGDENRYAEMKRVAEEKGRSVFSYSNIAKRSLEG